LQNPNDQYIKQAFGISLDYLIVDRTGNDDKWGKGSKVDPTKLGSGQNKLGLILMAVRNVLRPQK
jgi:predicted NAD-dependent protein-ADP-ribosyltransferase YbiA (DUF1768 family)